MKRPSQAADARASVLSYLRNGLGVEMERAKNTVRIAPDGFCRTYRRERRRLLGIAYRAAVKAAEEA